MKFLNEEKIAIFGFAISVVIISLIFYFAAKTC